MKCGDYSADKNIAVSFQWPSLKSLPLSFSSLQKPLKCFPDPRVRSYLEIPAIRRRPTRATLISEFLFSGHTHSIRKFPGQGLNPSHSCSNTRSLTCCARPGVDPVPLQRPEPLQSDFQPAVPQRELHFSIS